MEVFPSPVFEGSEKRLEVDFSSGPGTGAGGLRALTRAQLDLLLSKAACCIVSSKHNEHFDAYVLSESSLFVYTDKMVLKTCGTTRLLAATPTILQLAAGLDMRPRRCKYSRASFLFPEQQPAPHHDFDAEVAVLQIHFGHLGGGGGAYILGDAANGLQWHVYVAANGSDRAARPTYNLEICMTDLCAVKANQWFRCPKFISAKHTTASSGIGDLLPGAVIDDFVFEPCGYSMNGIEDAAFSTIHITPEQGQSYASVELSGYSPDSIDRDAVIAKVLEIFRPARAVVAMSVDMDVPCCPWSLSHLDFPEGYYVKGGVAQNFSGNGRTAFLSMGAHHAPPHHATPKVVDESDGPESPRGVVADEGGFGGPYTSAETSLAASMIESDGDSDADTAGIPPARLQAELARLVSKAAAFDGSACFSTGTGHFCAEHMSANPSIKTVPEVLEAYKALPLPAATDTIIDVTVAELIQQHGLEDPVYLVDLGMVRQLYEAWRRMMPRVHPHYAVKCFPDPALLAMLAAMGAGFDCASEGEVDLVTSLGVHPDGIVLANCCKRPRDIRRAAELGVQLTTFDTVSELSKLARWHPSTRALLRVRADDVTARCELGNKYGAEPAAAPALLQAAKELGISVIGISFHVGSGATNPAAFSDAIAIARKAFDEGLALGFDMHLLDIGGGFSGGTFDSKGCVDLGGVPAAVNAALDCHFPDGSGVTIIAEPGRYFAEASAHMACMVFGVRPGVEASGAPTRDYWITDGLYGSMNCLLYDHAVLQARPLQPSSPWGTAPPPVTISSTVFGPTCDGLDVVLRDVPLPEMQNGDWLLFPRMGAYTLCGAANFNGINSTSPSVFYVDSGA